MTEPPVDDPVAAATDAVPTTETFDRFCTLEGERLAKALALALDNRELGRDAAAEAMARAWERWSTVSEYDNTAGWCYRVGLNWGRSRLRRRRREVTTAFPPDAPHDDPVVDDIMTTALAKLSTDHRAVIVGRFYLDWSEADLATALAIPTGTAKSRLSRALAQLEQHLGADDV